MFLDEPPTGSRKQYSFQFVLCLVSIEDFNYYVFKILTGTQFKCVYENSYLLY